MDLDLYRLPSTMDRHMQSTMIVEEKNHHRGLNNFLQYCNESFVSSVHDLVLLATMHITKRRKILRTSMDSACV